MVQDTQAINEAVITFYPIMHNTYTILTQISEGTTWITVLDLKDTFFCIPLYPGFQYLFCFQWTDPSTNVTQHYTLTVLPQSCRDGPTYLAILLPGNSEFTLNIGAVLKYVDNILIFTPSNII